MDAVQKVYVNKSVNKLEISEPKWRRFIRISWKGSEQWGRWWREWEK